jgi:hypothetical protein
MSEKMSKMKVLKTGFCEKPDCDHTAVKPEIYRKYLLHNFYCATYLGINSLSILG